MPLVLTLFLILNWHETFVLTRNFKFSDRLPQMNIRYQRIRSRVKIYLSSDHTENLPEEVRKDVVLNKLLENAINKQHIF